MLLFSIMRCEYKKGVVTLKFPWTLWLVWLLKDYLCPLLCFKILLSNALLNYGTIYKEIGLDRALHALNPCQC